MIPNSRLDLFGFLFHYKIRDLYRMPLSCSAVKLLSCYLNRTLHSIFTLVLFIKILNNLKTIQILHTTVD